MTDRVVTFRNGTLPTGGVSPGDLAAEAAAREAADDALAADIAAEESAREAGNRYAVASAVVSEAFPVAAAAPLAAPEWGANMTAAARAQAAIVIGESAAPDRLAVIIGDDPQAALAALGVVRVAEE